MNTEVLAVSDDPLGKQGVRLEDQKGTVSSPDVFVGELKGGAFVAVLFNRGSAAANMTLALIDLKTVNAAIVADTNGFKFRDLWRHADRGTVTADGCVTTMVGPQDAIMLKLAPETWVKSPPTLHNSRMQNAC